MPRSASARLEGDDPPIRPRRRFRRNRPIDVHRPGEIRGRSVLARNFSLDVHALFSLVDEPAGQRSLPGNLSAPGRRD